jgi:hypothetical protein
VTEQRAARKAQKAEATAQARQAKEHFVVEAEKLAAGNDWRGGVNRFRELLDEWKALPRLDRATDDELWHRFSGARTTYTRRRKSQFAKESEQRAARKAQKAEATAKAKEAKERYVVEAEKLAAGNDWRGGVNRFRELLDEWKALPRLDRATDDELWHRFSGARTTYTRRRKSQFAKESEQRETARVAKEKLVAEAEALQNSTDWGATTSEYRDLMTRWKAAGSAPRGVDDELWKRFRGAQDVFFGAKSAAMSEQDSEFRTNGVAKQALVEEAEAILPVRDLAVARAAYRDVLERWAEIGKVPREMIRPLDSRLRAVESAIKGFEDDQWRRTNPEARARAEETADKLVTQIAALEEKAAKAEARGDAKAARDATASAETYREWLAQARKAADDFSG